MAHDSSAAKGADRASAGELLYRIRYLLCAVTLAIVEFVSVAPCSQYITLTFFAEAHGGGDCAATPSSGPCRRAASDAALYYAVSSGACNSVGAVMALVLGSYSDKVGRRPLLRIRSWMSLLPPVTLAAHVFAGQTLWLFLLGGPIFRACDVSGVYLATVNDLVANPRQQAGALGLFMTWCVVIVASMLPLAGLLPAPALVLVSLAAAGAKLAYMYTSFPETLQAKAATARPQGLLDGPQAALGVFTRNSVILRVATLLVLSSVSSAGMGTVLGPYLTGYLGLTRSTGTGLTAVAVASGTLGLALAGPAVRCAGEVGALRACLVATVAFPVLCGACGDGWQVAAVVAALCPALFMLVPIISGIKSNLVAKDEQGLIQGSIACICNLATATADVFFGWAYRHFTDGGAAAERSVVLPIFHAIALLAAAAWLLALSLPLALPPPPSSGLAAAAAAEALLQAERP